MLFVFCFALVQNATVISTKIRVNSIQSTQRGFCIFHPDKVYLVWTIAGDSKRKDTVIIC